MKKQLGRTGHLVSLTLALVSLINWTVLPASAHNASMPVERLTSAATFAAAPIHSDKSHGALERLRRQYNTLPLRFEAAASRANAPAHFIARNGMLRVDLTASAARVALPCADTVTSVSWQLIGANHRARIRGEARLPMRTSYLIGKDAAEWHTDVDSFERVRVSQVYRGVDVVYYGSGHALEYDLHLAPRADVRAIRLRFSGARNVRVDDAGDLILDTAAGQLRQHKPVAYQSVNHARRTVAARFVIDRRGDVRFRIGPYDKRLPLVIDPVLSYATYFGSRSTGDAITAVATDGAGNAYIAGNTYAADLPTTPGALQPINRSNDGFIAKFNPEGTALIYATYFGGSSYDSLSSIAVDAAGNAYVTGQTNSSDLPTTAQAFQVTAPDLSSHTFVAKLNPMGTALIYSTYLASKEEVTAGTAIAVTSAGEATVAGYTTSPRFPVTAGALQSTFGGLYDAFVARLNRDGSALLFSTFLGGVGLDQVSGLALDVAGNVYIAGGTSSKDFPTTPHAYKKKSAAGGAFIAKINSDGDRLAYSTFFGGNSTSITGIAVDPYGNAYLTGFLQGPELETTPGAPQPATLGLFDGFVAKLNSNGRALVYATYLGGSDVDYAAAITVDAVGQAYVTGMTFSTDFPVANALQPRRRGSAMYKSTDGGESWNDIPVPLSYVQSLAIGPQASAAVYASSFGSIVKSTDGGASWQNVTRDMTATLVPDPFDPLTLYAYNDNTLFKSTDAGATWERNGFLNGPGGARTILGLVIDPQAHDTLYLNTSLLIAVPDAVTTQSLAPLPQAALLKSTDGGASWTALDLRLSVDEAVTSVAVDPQVTSTLYANASRTGLLKSTDGGANWFNPNSSVTFFVSQLVIDPTDSATLYGVTTGGVVKSTNGGGSWSPLSLPDPRISMLKINPQSPSTLYASSYEAIYRTTDGGASWQVALEGAAAPVIRLDPQHPSTIYAAGSVTSDIFVTKLNASGTGLVYSTYLGSPARDRAAAIATDHRGNAFIVATSDAKNFPTTPGVYLPRGMRPYMGVLMRINDVTPLRITNVEVKGKKLLVTGEGFDQGAVIVAGSTDLSTQNDPASPSLLLISARGGKQIPRGQTTAIRVRNADGRVSEPFNFTRGTE